MHISSNRLFEAKRAGRPFLVTSAYYLKFILRFSPKCKPPDVNGETAPGEPAAMIRSEKPIWIFICRGLRASQNQFIQANQIICPTVAPCGPGAI